MFDRQLFTFQQPCWIALQTQLGLSYDPRHKDAWQEWLQNECFNFIMKPGKDSLWKLRPEAICFDTIVAGAPAELTTQTASARLRAILLTPAQLASPS